ncbi:MAG: hypothetical protein PHF63_00765 [Herbinix sp.]|nr:hypothetical protein [Herbinix sp.]
MKGKKFDAAEKHFMEKEARLKKQINSLEARNSELRAALVEKTSENNSLSTKNAELEDWIERLLIYTELNREDIKRICQEDKRKGENINMVLHLMSRFI